MRLLAKSLLVGLAVFVSTCPAFTKVTTGDIVNDGGWCYACAWADYDRDGFLDLVVTNNNPGQSRDNFLYRNNGDGSFTRVLAGPVGSDDGSSYGCTWGDYDNDDCPDLFVSNYNENNFLYLGGDSGFTKVISGRVVSDGGKSTGAAWADYDADGRLDLFVCNRDQVNFLYHGAGDTFARVTTGPVATDVANSGGCAWADYDNDGDLDLFVANVQVPNCLYRNDGGAFAKVTGDPVVSDTSNCNGASWGDFDNDGDLDLFVATGVLGMYNDLLYRNDGDGSFTKVTDSPVVETATWSGGGAWGDFDNDGDLDLFVGGYDGPNRLYANDGAGNFAAVDTGVVVTDGNYIMGSTWVDIDRDGDLDLFTARNNYYGGNNALYRNDGFGSNWLVVCCVGSVSNRSGIGARVRVRADVGGPAWQTREISTQSGGGNSAQNPSVAHFGLGTAAVVDTLEVRWPSGSVQQLTGIAVNRYIVVTEPSAAVAEPAHLAGGYRSPATFCRGSLVLTSAFRVLTSDFVLLDASGRKVMSLHAGANDVSHLAPGVYFLRDGEGPVSRVAVIN